MRNPVRRAAGRTGGMLVLIAICMPIFLLMAAFAVDVAYMQLTRTELRTATDAAARAGAKTLSLLQDDKAARAAARDAALRNVVAGQGLIVEDRQIEFGLGSQASDTARFTFSPGGSRLNAVRVTGLRTKSSAAGPVGLLLGRVLGVSQFQPVSVAASTQLDRDICLVVDRSGSMMESINGGSLPGGPCSVPHPDSRWMALNSAVLAFVDELEATHQSEQCGLTSYSSNGIGCGVIFRIATTDAPLGYSYQPIRNEMARMSSGPTQGMTSISSGIDEGIKVLTSKAARKYAVKTMVVMTDGLHNQGREPIKSAQDAKKKNITVNTVTFSVDADLKRMKAVAEATGGRHFHAPNAAALESIFREIASTLPVMLTE